MKGYIQILGLVTLVMIGALSLITSVKFKKHKLSWKIITLYLIGSFIAQGITYAYWEMKWNNLKILHIYSIFQFASFSAFYWSVAKSVAKQRLILIFSGTISGLLIVNSIWHESLQDFNSLGIFFSNGTIVVYAILHFFEILGADIAVKKYTILNAGILLFVSESLVLFLFGNLLKDISFFDQAGLWYTHASTNLIFLLLILWNHVKLNR